MAEPQLSSESGQVQQLRDSSSDTTTDADDSNLQYQVVRGLPVQAQQVYTSQNIYSLPVSLPSGGEIRLDFARPSGQAELSIWAVPQKTITNLVSTLVIVVLLVLLVAIMKLLKQYNKKRTIPGKTLIVYAVLFVISTLLFGLFGMIASLLIILLSEGRHIIFA
jgi:hypothetical protein